MASVSELFRHLRVTKFFRVEIDHRNAHTMFRFAFSQIVQMPTPVAVLFEILGHVFRDEDVTSVTAIHHPLSNIDPGAGDVGAPTHIHHATDRSAVHAHAQLEFEMFLHRAADLECAFDRRFRSVVKNQRHAVAAGDGNQAPVCLGCAEVFRAANDLIE